MLQVGVQVRRSEAYLKVGLGFTSRPTPYRATMKKCMTSREGLGARPDSREIGPDE